MSIRYVLGSGRSIGGVLGSGRGGGGNGLLTGLVSFWSLDETTGNRADSHGANTMTPVGSPSYRAGHIGNAVDIPNSSHYLAAGAGAQLSVGSSMTIAAWVYADSLSTYGYPIARWGAANGDYALYILSNGAGFSVAYANSNSKAAQDTGMAISAWRLLIGWFDHTVGSYGTVYFQLDTANPVSAAMTAAHTSSVSETLAIGKLGVNAFGNFDGAVDNAALWSRVLSAAERTALYNGGAGLAYSAFTV